MTARASELIVFTKTYQATHPDMMADARNEQLRERYLGRMNPLGQSSRNRLHSAGPNRMAARHEGGSRRHAVTLHVEVQQSQALRGELVQPGSRCAAQEPAAITPQLTPAEVVGQD